MQELIGRDYRAQAEVLKTINANNTFALAAAA
jgi:hypothetical protein